MKKVMSKRWLACLLALCALLALSACGGKTPARYPKTALQAALEKLNDAKSFSFDLEALITLSSQGEELTMGTTTNGDIIKEPFQAHGSIHTNILYFKRGMEEYVVQENGSPVSYSGYTQNGVITQWNKSVLSMDDSEGVQGTTASYDVTGIFATQFELVDEIKEIGVEEVAEKQATRYDGVIHGSHLGKALEQARVEDILDELGINLTRVGQDIPVSIWIYEDGYPAKFEIDMTEVLAQILAETEDASEIDSSSLRIFTTITGVDNVSEIVVPQEALDACAVSAD